MALVKIENLTVAIQDGASPQWGHARRRCAISCPQLILDQVSLEIPAGQIVGLVGGSGCGKTTLGLAMLRLLPPVMEITAGQILFEARDLASTKEEDMRALRGKQIGMVFQEPLASFDPLFTIGYQLDETLAAHTDMDVASRARRVVEVLNSVEIADVNRVMQSYPHQLSGGQRQRAMIAQAIVCGPKLIIADEATSSLDVILQAKIIKLLRKLNAEQGMSIVFISHDLGMVGHLAHELMVMSQGKIVEQGPSAEILARPRHAYTKALIEAY